MDGASGQGPPPLQGGPADVLTARGHPRTWLGAEDSTAPSGHCWAAWASWAGDRRRMRGRGSFRPPQDPVSWTKAPPSPKPQEAPPPRAGFLSPSSLSILLVTFSVCLHPCLYFLFSLCITCSLCVCLLFLYLLSFCLCLFSAVSSFLLSFLLCSTRVSPLVHFCFLSSAPSSPSFTSNLCSLSLPSFPHSPNLTCHKREKRKKKKNQNTKKPKLKQISSVLQSAASSWWPLCVSLWPAACPPTPARLPRVLPACPSCR